MTQDVTRRANQGQPTARLKDGADATAQAGPNEDGGAPAQEQKQGGGTRKKQARGPGKKGGGGKVAKRKAPDVVAIRPIAAPASMKVRHWGLMISFALAVLLPLTLTCLYLWLIAADQYGSSSGFTVRQEESGSASELLGGLAKFAGGAPSGDSDILYEFIRSQEIVAKIDAELDLVGHYSSRWPADPVFALKPDATIEELESYWQRIVRISYDQSSGLIDLEVVAFEPEMAQAVARAIVRESQATINALNATAREDAMRYARADLEESLDRLKEARQALTNFRTRTQIVDPDSDIQGRMGVLNNLQQQLAEALIQYDILRETTNATDPRILQARRRIEVIRARIAEERENFATADQSGELGGLSEDYPNLIAEFESLSVDREFAEETYRAALTAVDVARANSMRQSRYLATFVQPTLAQSSQYPQRFTIAGLAALFLILAWGIAALIYYSIRDRS